MVETELLSRSHQPNYFVRTDERLLKINQSTWIICVQDREGKAQEIQSKQYPTLVEALQQSWKSINPSKTHKLMPVILCEYPLACLREELILAVRVTEIPVTV